MIEENALDSTGKIEETQDIPDDVDTIEDI